MLNGIIEIVGEVLLENAFLIMKNEKINKYLRIFLTICIFLFYGFITLVLFVGGVSVLNKNIIAGIFLMILSLFILFCLIVTLKKSNDEEN